MLEESGPAVINTSGVAIDRVKERLLPWLRSIVDSVEQEEGLVFVLAQVTSLAGDKPVRTIRYDFDRPPEETVHQIVMAACDDMEGGNFKTDVGYCVTIDGQEDERFNFTLKATRGHGHDEQRRRDFFPDMQGLTGQLMEQNLQLTDKVIDASGATTSLLMKIIEQKDAEIVFLKRRQYQRDEEIQKLMDGTLKRTMMYEEHTSKLKQQESMAEGFKQMAPPIVASLAGPQAAAMAAALLQNGMGNGLQLPGMSSGPSDEDLLDDLILRLEQNPQMRDKLFEVLLQDQEAIQVLSELHKRSMMRREQRARQQAEESEKRQGERNGYDNERGERGAA